MKRVLVVEDDFIIQMFIEKVIQDLEWNLIGTASRSDQALDLLENNPVDIIMMDIGIDGDKDGVETVVEIRKKMPDVKVVFVTGNADEFTMDRAKETNPLGFVFKPIDEDKLKAEMLRFGSMS